MTKKQLNFWHVLSDMELSLLDSVSDLVSDYAIRNWLFASKIDLRFARLRVLEDLGGLVSGYGSYHHSPFESEDDLEDALDILDVELALLEYEDPIGTYDGFLKQEMAWVQGSRS